MGHPGCRFIPANPRFSSIEVIHLELDEEIPVCHGPCEITRRFEGITSSGTWVSFRSGFGR